MTDPSHAWPLANLDALGPVLAWWKVLPMTVVALAWLKVTQFTFHDTRQVGLPPAPWTAGVFGAGLLGLAAAILVPIYAVGQTIQVLLTVGSFVGYVVVRNGKVKPDRRLGSLRQLKVALLAQFGKVPEPTREQAPDTAQSAAILDPMGRVIVHPENEADQAGHDLARKLIFEAVQRRASEIDLAVAAKGKVTFKIDGVQTDVAALDRATAESLLGMLKTYARLDRSDYRRPQEGDVSVQVMKRDVKLHVETRGSTQGVVLKARFQGDDVPHRVTDLGLLPRQAEALAEIQQQDGGLVIIAGRRGQGLSTTLYALAREHDAFMRNIVSFERRRLMALDNIRQTIVPTDSATENLAGALASALASDPDIVLVDPLDTPAAAQQVQAAVAAGKKAYVTIAQPDAFLALEQWLRWIGQPQQAAAHLRAVLAQRVLRKLCTTCREAYAPDPAVLKRANIPADKVQAFYRPPTRQVTDDKGNVIVCQDCQGTGYVGQLALYELFVLTDEARQLIATSAGANAIKAEARKHKMLYLQEVGLRRVIEGVTSIQEVLRVTQE